MSEPAYRLAPLDPALDLLSFDCGEPAYNTWLTDVALRSSQAGSSAVYVLVKCDEHQDRVVGYFAICPTTIVRDAMPKPLRRGMLRSTPGWLLAKLAIDRSLRGRQWGRQLLREALEVIVDAAERGGGAVIVVDAGNEGLIKFYEQSGFARTGANDLRLFLKLSTARAYLRPPSH